MVKAADNLLVGRRRALALDGLPPRAVALLVGIVATSAAGAGAGFEAPVRRSSWLVFVALSVPAALAQLFAIQKPRHQVFHAALVFVIAGALLLPTPLLALMCVIQHIPDWIRHRYRWYIQTFNISNYLVSSLAAAEGGEGRARGDGRCPRRVHGRPFAARPSHLARDRGRAGPGRHRAGGARAGGASPRHREDRDPGRDPAQARAPDPGGVAGHADALAGGRADHRAARLPRRGRPGHPPPPRAARRERLPRR